MVFIYYNTYKKFNVFTTPRPIYNYPLLLKNNNSNYYNNKFYNPIIGSSIGVPLNILQYIFTYTYFNENIVNRELFILQIAIGIFTYGTDRFLDALDYTDNLNNNHIYSQDKIDYYNYLIKNTYFNIFIIFSSFIYINNIIKDNIETHPFIYAISSTLFYRNFKENFGEFKSLYIAIFWTLGAVILPCVLYENNYEILYHPTIYMPNFFLMFASSNALDIKDIDEDKNNNIYTLPVIIGKKNTLLLNNLSYIIAFSIYFTNFLY